MRWPGSRRDLSVPPACANGGPPRISTGSGKNWRWSVRWPRSSDAVTRWWPSRCPTSDALSRGCGSRDRCSSCRSCGTCAIVLSASRLVDAELRRVADQAPRAAALAVPLPDKAIDRRLELSVGDDGELLDTASPALAAARREIQAARQRLVRKLEGILRGLDAQATIKDAGVTVRGGRYVIPVRRDSRSRPGGIVHDESASAGTLFVEPSEAVELGNAYREAQAEEEREVLRVLRELTAILRPAREVLTDALEMCVQVDDLVARARYAVAVLGEVPEMMEPGGAAAAARGAASAAARARRRGDPVLARDARRRAHAAHQRAEHRRQDGDAQDHRAGGAAGPERHRAAGRSWYRAYRCSPRCSPTSATASRSPRASRPSAVTSRRSAPCWRGPIAATLVLLDEVGSGTDPAEGAALAAAVLLELTRRGALTLATTHLGALKSLAAEAPGIVNGSLQFDTETLSPTYRFRKGVPGPILRSVDRPQARARRDGARRCGGPRVG